MTDVALTNRQLALAEMLSRRYYQSPSVIFKSFVAAVPRRRVRERVRPAHVGAVIAKPRIIRGAVRQAYVLFDDYRDVLAYIAQILQRLPVRAQIAIIIPEHSQRERIVELLHGLNLIRESVIMPDLREKTAYHSAWAASRRARVVVGSLTALFLPYMSLRQIIVIEAEHQQFQRAEQNPRYHLADIIFNVVNLYRCPLLLTGFSPDVSLLYACGRRHIPLKRIGGTSDALTIISLGASLQEFKNLSSPVIEALRKTSGRALIICNRHGQARAIICRDCGSVSNCVSCGKPLVVEGNGRDMACYACGTRTDMVLTCPRCNSAAISLRGAGVGRVVQELKKLFPKRTVVELTARAAVPVRDANTADIVVATNRFFSERIKPFALAAMINPDLDLNLPTIHAAEALRHFILKLRASARTVMVQTRTPDHYVYRTLLSVRDFFGEEIAWRERFTYPPFVDIVQLRAEDSRREVLAGHVAKMRELLRGIQFEGPRESYERGMHRAIITVRCPQGRLKALLDARLPSVYTWLHTDVNPYRLL